MIRPRLAQRQGAGSEPHESATLGATVRAPLTNGFGSNTDWLALAPVGAPGTDYLRWV
jgi:hypothetical protein